MIAPAELAEAAAMLEITPHRLRQLVQNRSALPPQMERLDEEHVFNHAFAR